MPRVKVHFKRIVQDIQNYGCFDKNDDFMVARIEFAVETKDRVHEDLSVEVRQPCGTDYETEPIEAAKPEGDGPSTWNHVGFLDLCETYYRRGFGRAASEFHVGPGVRMRGNIVGTPWTAELEIPSDGSDAW